MADLTRRAVDGELVAVLDTLASMRLDALDIGIVDALDPRRSPVELLPWLAWHYGLLHFDSRWDESLQREVIANARMLLRERGTRAGVERALAPFGSSVELVERRDDPALTPGSFVVRVPEGDPLIGDLALQEDVDKAIRRAAPLTRAWTVEIGDSVEWAPLAASTTRTVNYVSVEGVANG